MSKKQPVFLVVLLLSMLVFVCVGIRNEVIARQKLERECAEKAFVIQELQVRLKDSDLVLAQHIRNEATLARGKEEAELRLAKKEEQVQVLQEVVKSAPNNTHRLKVTGYTLSRDECGPEMQPYMKGEVAVPGQTVGVSHDLKKWMGRRIYIEGFGIRKVNDLMASTKKNQVDILVDTKEIAFKEVGLRKGVPVVLLAEKQ